MRSTAPVGALAVAAVLAVTTGVGPTGAQESTPPPARDAFVAGQVVDDAGTPAAGVDVVVRRSPGIAERVGGFTTFLFTAGLACVAATDACIPDESVFARTVTDGDGGYRLPLGPEYVAGSESDTDFYVTASRPAGPGELSGSATTEEFEVAQEVQTSPPLRLWAPPTTVELTAAVARVTWDPMDPDGFDDGSVEHTLRFLTTSGVVLAAVDASGERLDARMLEDATGAVALVARADITVGPTIYHQTYEAPRLAFEGPAGPPPSRTKACTVRRADGSTLAVAAACPLTDGDLDGASVAPAPGACVDPTDLTLPTIAPPPGFAPTPAPPPCPAPLADATIDLGAALDIGLVVIRGCDSCSLSTSMDGVAFTPFGGSGAARTAPRATNARYVRVEATPETGAVLDGVVEVSVWPADGRERAPIGPDGVATGPARSPASEDGGGRGPAAVLALVLVLVVGVALAARRGRRPDDSSGGTWPRR